MNNSRSQSSLRGSPVVPREYGGKWIAWNQEGTQILAASEDLTAAEEAARQAGESRPRLEKVPRSDARIIGGTKR